MNIQKKKLKIKNLKKEINNFSNDLRRINQKITRRKDKIHDLKLEIKQEIRSIEEKDNAEYHNKWREKIMETSANFWLVKKKCKQNKNKQNEK